jgi:diguanylate cyclase (GGDEF)-like protein
MIDIDHFKNVNDTYGHQIGDLVLQKLGAVFLETLRDIDRVGRVGGEEFAVVLPQTDEVRAIEVAERLRQLVEATEIALKHGLPLHFTISIGVTTLVDTKANIDTLLGQADQALYKAKHLGRNQVCVHGE